MEIKKYGIMKINNGEAHNEEDAVIAEHTITIFLNGAEFISLICTPRSMEDLVVGFLYSEGIINSKDDLESVHMNAGMDRAHVCTKNRDSYSYSGAALQGKRTVTTACGRQKSISYNVVDFLGTESDRIKACPELASGEILELVNIFNRKSELFISSGGVHSCALCSNREFIVFEEDIGRHNALDKILGNALRNGIFLEDKIIITSGRISSEMVIKALRCRIPAIVSRSAPTDAAVELARKYNMVLIGFARGKRMNIYSNFENIS